MNSPAFVKNCGTCKYQYLSRTQALKKFPVLIASVVVSVSVICMVVGMVVYNGNKACADKDYTIVLANDTFTCKSMVNSTIDNDMLIKTNTNIEVGTAVIAVGSVLFVLSVGSVARMLIKIHRSRRYVPMPDETSLLERQPFTSEIAPSSPNHAVYV